MIKRYPSIAALRAHFLDLGGNGYDGERAGSSWYGGESPPTILEKSLIGDQKLVAEAQKYLNQLQLEISTPRRVWERAPVGAFCVVPDVLAGLPTPMRRQVHRPDERAPIDIFVDLGSSGGISGKTLTKRGTIVLALTLALSRVRPISLNIIDCGNGSRDKTGETIIAARIETAPLDLSLACYVLTSPGFVRWLLYGHATQLNGFSGSWPKNFSYQNPQPFYTRLLPRLDVVPERTLLIPATRLNDTMLSRSIEWVNKQIKRFTTEQEELV